MIVTKELVFVVLFCLSFWFNFFAHPTRKYTHWYLASIHWLVWMCVYSYSMCIPMGCFLVILVENKALKLAYLYEGPAAISVTQEIDDYVQVLWSNILNTYLQR